MTNQPQRSARVTQLSHRPDIDGLRALAILPVVLYHAGLPGFSGGFVGVDVFFVISGFLITRLICAELDAGSFTLTGFYERRLRRLAPALLAVLLFTAVAAHFLLLPSFHVEFSRALLATLLFGANIHQALLLSDYFAPNADTQPLLHMWSLAVEEQFYLLFPLLLMWLSKNYAKQQRLIVAAIALGSLALCIVWTPLHPAGAFYFPHTRAWELLLGALLALGVAPTLSRATAEVLALLGLLCIGISVTAFSDATAFPGWAALLPCMGTALCIHANSDRPTSVGLWLSWRPVVYIGLLSYSLYLWHWPLLVLGKYWLVREYTPWEIALILSLSLAAAALSYHFVEQPCRRRRGGIPLRRLLPACITIAMALGLTATYRFLSYDTSPSSAERVQLTLQQHHSRRATRQRYADDCVAQAQPAYVGEYSLCQLGSRAPSNAPPLFLLWGDSHAASQYIAIDRLASEWGISGHFPQHKNDFSCPIYCEHCEETIEPILQYIHTRGIQDVLLICRWDGQFTSIVPDSSREAEIEELLQRHQTTKLRSLNERVHLRFAKIHATGATIWFLMQVPYLNISRRTLEYAAHDAQGTSTTLYAQEQGNFRAMLQAMLERIPAAFNIQILDPMPLMCSKQGCPYIYQGEAVYIDEDHLQRITALRYKDVFLPMMEAIVTRQKPVITTP